MPEKLAGVRFKCTRCGKCCSSPNLIVNITPRDVQVISKHLKTQPDKLTAVIGFYQVSTPGGTDDAIVKRQMVFPPLKTHKGMAYLGLLKRPNGDCIFLKENKCSIYAARPRICQAFPYTFNDENEASLARFAVETCPGIGQGEEIKVEKVLAAGRVIVDDINDAFSFARRWNARKDDDPGAFKPARLLAEMARFKTG